MTFLVKGCFLDTPIAGEIRCRDGYLLIQDGSCGNFYKALPPELTDLPVHDFSGCLITPGLVDLHLHAPQYSYCGTAMDVELLAWLNQYTFPEEARYRDPDYAERSYRLFVRDLLHSPTTRFCAFASQHTDATLTLMRQLEAAGLRGYVGKVNMDRNSPDYYCETTESGIAETYRWLDTWQTLTAGLVRPMLTPRFTPSVSDPYMQTLGRIAAERGLPVQSHLSENPDEIAWVAALCPDTDFYAQSYARYGLFGGSCPTVMAHCIYSTPEEQALLRENQVYIAHCPTSNENVIAGIAPAAHYLRNDFRIGLGSDVAGGHTLNLFAVMVSAVQVSKLRWRYVDSSVPPLTLAEAFYLATVGGGRFFGRVGLFEPGYAFDAIVPDEAGLRNLRSFSPTERLERYAYLGEGRLLAKFVQGVKLL